MKESENQEKPDIFGRVDSLEQQIREVASHVNVIRTSLMVTLAIILLGTLPDFVLMVMRAWNGFASLSETWQITIFSAIVVLLATLLGKRKR